MADLMLADNLRERGIRDERVLRAIASLDRRLFVPREVASHASYDLALPIGHEQTISQPYVVAYMSEALGLRGDERVLEIGTGSGYQTAVLAQLAREVYSIEIIPALAERARSVLYDELGLESVHLRRGDGHRGWPEEAPFDAIVATAAPERIPEALIEQLAEGGRLVAPVGPLGADQDLVVIRRVQGDVEIRKVLGVRFVPMTHETLVQ